MNIPIVAVIIEIHTLKEICSFKNMKASNAVKKGIAAKHNKVMAAVVFVIGDEEARNAAQARGRQNEKRAARKGTKPGGQMQRCIGRGKHGKRLEKLQHAQACLKDAR